MKRLTRTGAAEDNAVGKKSRSEAFTLEELVEEAGSDDMNRQATPCLGEETPSQQTTPMSQDRAKTVTTSDVVRFCDNFEELMEKSKVIGDESDYALSKFTSWDQYSKLDKKFKTSVTVCGIVENNSSLISKAGSERYDLKLRVFNNEQDKLLALAKNAANGNGEIVTNRFSNNGSMIHFTPKVFNKVEKKKFVMESFALNETTHKFEKRADLEPGKYIKCNIVMVMIKLNACLQVP
jgi:hypothetical protein